MASQSTVEDGWQDPPCQVVDLGTDKGRGLFATRDIPSGHVYFRAQPFTIVVCQEWVRNVCVGCMTFTPTHTMKVRCACACTFYCSDACRDSDHARHSVECAAFGRLAIALRGISREDLFIFKTQARFVISLLASKRDLERRVPPSDASSENGASVLDRAISQAALAAPPTVADMLSLVSNRAKYDKDQKTMQMWRDVCALVRSATPELITESDEAVIDIICREECNSFGFWDDGDELYAYGLFPHASYFNHDCAPNTFKFTKGRDVFFRSIKPLKAGDELFISYVLVSDHTELRRQQLMETYQFMCQCSRCVAGVRHSYYFYIVFYMRHLY